MGAHFLLKFKFAFENRKTKRSERMPKSSLWVVYRMTLSRMGAGAHAVCEQDEWDAMEASSPGYHTLIRQGIGSETEAETLARSGSAALATAKDAKRNAAREARALERTRAGLSLTPSRG